MALGLLGRRAEEQLLIPQKAVAMMSESDDYEDYALESDYGEDVSDGEFALESQAQPTSRQVTPSQISPASRCLCRNFFPGQYPAGPE